MNYQYYTLDNYVGTFLFNNGHSTNLSFTEAISRNSIDAPIYPRTGSTLTFSLKFTLPYSLLGLSSSTTNSYKLPEFHKWRMNAEWYVPIGTARGAEKNKAA